MTTLHQIIARRKRDEAREFDAARRARRLPGLWVLQRDGSGLVLNHCPSFQHALFVLDAVNRGYGGLDARPMLDTVIWRSASKLAREGQQQPPALEECIGCAGGPPLLPDSPLCASCEREYQKYRNDYVPHRYKPTDGSTYRQSQPQSRHQWAAK